MARKVTTDEFVERARAVHGDAYDYSESVYAGTHEKLRIICPEHGVFEQSPANHLKGRGCPECGKVKAGNARRLGLDEFIEKARAVHGNFYDYSQVEYKTNATPVTIVCPEHGPFEQTPNGHLSGRGCRKCAGNMPYTTESFIEAARDVHGDAFDYSKVEYKGGHEKVCITCPVHGDFWQEPVYHLKGGGCPTCSKIRGHKLHRDHAAEVRKREATMVERYGVAHALESDEFKQKAKDTWVEHYGVDHPMKSDGVKQNYVDTMVEHYGVDYPYQSESVKAKVVATKRENGTFNTSRAEERLYAMLLDVFGKDDVERQFSDERYPFACDFYITSLDLFIELNASWTHGGQWFDSDDEACLDKLHSWIVRSSNSKYYRNAISVWIGADVRKRIQAQVMGLNYVVFWDNDLTDAFAWIDEGCPLRRDYD